jgi:hypothetical protein
VDIGAELFAMAATCSRAHMLARQGDENARDLADVFCREARVRIADHFRHLFGPNDGALYRLSQRVLKGEYTWLEEGIVGLEGAAPQASGFGRPDSDSAVASAAGARSSVPLP